MSTKKWLFQALSYQIFCYTAIDNWNDANCIVWYPTAPSESFNPHHISYSVDFTLTDPNKSLQMQSTIKIFSHESCGSEDGNGNFSDPIDFLDWVLLGPLFPTFPSPKNSFVSSKTWVSLTCYWLYFQYSLIANIYWDLTQVPGTVLSILHILSS